MNNQQAPPAPSTPKSKSPPKWEAEAKERIKAAIRRFSKPLSDLSARDGNEGDTRLVITDFLCEGLGFDKYSELTTEYRVKGEFADFGIRLDMQMTAFIEVKRVNTPLNDKHLRQVQTYALNEGCEWVLLSNGNVWQLYHITAGLPVVVDLVHQADLLSEENITKKVDGFFYFSKEAMKRNLIRSLWETRRASSPESLAKLLLTEPVLTALRKELKKSTGQALDMNELIELLKKTVIKPDCL